MSKRIGVFGGSFDPIHYGHLLMAEQCRESARLDRVLFVPAHQSPLKPDAPIADPRQRVEMLQLATSGHDAFAIDRLELERTGPSYTVQTLLHLAKQLPGDELFFIIGSDALHDFARWRDPEQILTLARPLIVTRPGRPVNLELLRPLVPESRWPQIADGQVDAPLMEISSSDMRRRIATGRSIRYMTPRAVEAYIYTHRVYHPSASAS